MRSGPIWICTLALLCTSLLGATQQLGAFDVRRGADPFFLGSVRTQKDSSFQLKDAGKLDYNGRAENAYSYPAATQNPYLLGDVAFKGILLTYVADTLIRIMFVNIYTPRLIPDYEERAKQDFKRLCKFLKEQWQSPGKKRKFLQSPDKRIVSSGLQWNSHGKAMKVAFYEDKDKQHPLFEVSVTMELSAYD